VTPAGDEAFLNFWAATFFGAVWFHPTRLWHRTPAVT